MRGVVFLHAFPYNPRMWAKEAQLLKSRLPVLAPHYLGLSLGKAAEKVLQEMEEAGLEQAVFVGLSMGGYLAFELFRKAPERFLGAVLSSTRAGPDSEEAKKNRYALRERVLREGVGFLPQALLPSHLGRTTQATRPEVVAQARELILEASPEAVAESLLALAERPDSTPLLSRMGVPTLVLVGEEDTLTPPEEAKGMWKALPDARMLILPEAGHLANLENPKAFRTALLGFLAEFF
ncbi:alpha/beta hydrolase [Thermus sp. FJN-A]